ncbi:PREDICTED: testis-expressed sequence 10 protein homolog [Dufourea novaeangliae]|nr:PREDICTED: testis-expressed sequence 10 protein homolog [Dufourea novaeangliae]
MYYNEREQHKHFRNLKSEKAKVKLKAKKLPKGLNVTDPTFKVKKIVIREQLIQRGDAEVLSKRKLNVKDLLSRLQHHNSTVRQDAIKELKEILSQHSLDLFSSQFGSLLQGICALSLDKERSIRHDCFKVLSLIVGPVSNDQLIPYCDVLISYLRCAMTHIDPRIKEDALLYLDVLVQNCSSILAKNSNKVLPNFLDMISRLHTEMKPGRQLITTLNTKDTNVKWRIKVLERLATMFSSIVSFYKSQQTVGSSMTTQIVHVDKDTRYVPVYVPTYFENCEIDFERKDNSKENSVENALDAEELMRYVEVLMPLIFDSWIEVCPDDKNMDNSALLISTDALELLKSAVEIIQLIIECIDILHTECDINMKYWFKSNFYNAYIKNLLSKFPYNKLGTPEGFLTSVRNRKRQGDFSVDESYDVCLGDNLGLCQIYIWFTTIQSDDKAVPKLNKIYSTGVLKYLNGKLENWSSTNNIVLPQLTKLLRTLFLKASKFWYGNNLDLSETLQLVVNACCNQSRKEMHMQLFSVISDIMLDHSLHELHRECAFKEFISTLPSLLLKPRIHEDTIEIINKVILRYRNWVQDELAAHQNEIIDNAKKIEIIGSGDEKRSRLMICNLFYFLDAQIFY